MTINDSMFCLLSNCEKSISYKRLVYNMYIYQIAGFDFNFKYVISNKGIKSKSLFAYADELLCMGYIETADNGNFCITSVGNEALYSFVASQDELDFAQYIENLLNSLTLEDLHFIVLTDIVITETNEKYGVEGLNSMRDKIEDTIRSLSTEFSEENFNNSIYLLNKIKKGRL